MEYSINVYGPSKCIIEPVSRKSREKCLASFRQAFINRCRQPTTKWSNCSISSRMTKVKRTIVQGSDGYGYLAIWNTTSDSRISAEATMTGTHLNMSRTVS